MSKLHNPFSAALLDPNLTPMQGWKGPAPASEAILSQGQVNDSVRDKFPEVPKLLATRVVSLRCFWGPPTTSSVVTSKVFTSICSCCLPALGRLSYSVSSPPSAPLQTLFTCLWFSRELDCVSPTPLLRKRPAPLRVPEGVLQARDLLFKVRLRSKELDWQNHWPETPAKFITLLIAHIVGHLLRADNH